MLWWWMFPYKRQCIFVTFWKIVKIQNYLNYLENNMLNESLKVAVYIKINVNRIYEVFWLQNQISGTWFKQQLIREINRQNIHTKLQHL